MAAIIVERLSANSGTCEQPRAWHSTIPLGSEVLNPKPSPPISDLVLSQKTLEEDLLVALNYRRLNSSGQRWEIQTFSLKSRTPHAFALSAQAAASEIKKSLGLLSLPSQPA